MNEIPVNRRVAGAGLLTLLVSGCVVAPLPAYDAGPVVQEAPPPPRYEVVPAAPALGWIWIAGWWGWHLGRYHWNPGHWHEPRPGYRWRQPRWEPHSRGWRFRGGGWDRHR